MTLQELYQRFEEQPTSNERQILLAEALLESGRPDLALKILNMPTRMDETGRQVKDGLISAAYDGLGRDDEAQDMNIALSFSSDGRVWAALAEGARAAAAGDRVKAVRWFTCALDDSLAPTSGLSRLSRLPRINEALISAIFKTYPHLAAHKAEIHTAMDQAVFEFHPVGARFSAHDPVFSDPASGATAAEAVLKAHWRRYEAGKSELPPMARLYQDGPVADPDGLGFLLITDGAFNDPENPFGNNDFAEAQITSARELGMRAHLIQSQPLEQLPPEEICATIASHIEANDIQLLNWSVETNWQSGPKWANALTRLKEMSGVKIASFLFDPHEFYTHHQPWLFADVFDVPTHAPSTSGILDPYRRRTSLVPIVFHAMADAALADVKVHNRDMDLVFTGRVTRARRAMIEAVAPLFERTHIRMANLPDAPEPLSIADYRALLKRSKFTINCSYEAVVESPKARQAEAIQHGVLVFELGDIQMAETYLPYIHYVPVANRGQLTAFATYLRDHPDWRDRIAEEGRAFFNRHYSAQHYWRRVVGAAGL